MQDSRPLGESCRPLDECVDRCKQAVDRLYYFNSQKTPISDASQLPTVELDGRQLSLGSVLTCWLASAFISYITQL